jgi:hypothetical protein
MTHYQIILFTLFFLIATIMLLDRNVAEYFNLKLQIVGINLRRWYLMTKLHPRNPLTNYVMNRKMKTLAKELAIKIKEKQKDVH